jgi:hypothetical protein
VKRLRPKTLPELLKADRNAATVFAAVVYLAKGQRRIAAKRAEISGICGLIGRRITTALQALDKGGWLIRSYIWNRKDDRTSSLYLFTLPLVKLPGMGSRRPPTSRKPASTKSVKVEKRTSHPRVRRSFFDMGRSENDLLLPKGSKVVPPALNSGEDTTPVLMAGHELERLKILQIRQRKALEQATTQTEVAT